MIGFFGRMGRGIGRGFGRVWNGFGDACELGTVSTLTKVAGCFAVAWMFNSCHEGIVQQMKDNLPFSTRACTNNPNAQELALPAAALIPPTLAPGEKYQIMDAAAYLQGKAGVVRGPLRSIYPSTLYQQVEGKPILLRHAVLDIASQDCATYQSGQNVTFTYNPNGQAQLAPVPAPKTQAL